MITDVDTVLYDTFGQVQGDGLDLEDFVRDSGAKVVICSWNLQPDLIERASINTVTTYIRSGYRKIDVTRRSQAVRWGTRNGFEPDTERTIDPALRVRTVRAS